MTALVQGIHHLTAIAGDAQENVDFYAHVLGLRLVKKTINFDDPGTFHLYYGDYSGNPGSIVTFFPWTRNGYRGNAGTGQTTVTAYSIPPQSLQFWVNRLQENMISFAGPITRFEDDCITFHDPDGLPIELVASVKESRQTWASYDIPAEHVIRGFHHAVLTVTDDERTTLLLTELLGFRLIDCEGNRQRYESGSGGPGSMVDVVSQPTGRNGQIGIGTIHHIAFRVRDAEKQFQLRNQLIRHGYNVSPIIDRQYFHSIYFREPNNILFEIATDPPGFTVDETLAELGGHLKLPPWLELQRATIENALPPLKYH